MSQAITGTSLKAVFRFPFQGKGWQNRFLVGSALSLAGLVIPILPFIFVNGYVLAILRQAIKGEDLELPAWGDWGKLGVDGLRQWLITLVYLLPGLVVMVVGVVAYFATFFAAVPLAEASNSSGPEALGFLAALYGGMAIMFLCMAVGWLLLILGAIPLPVAIAHFAIYDRVAAAFRVREWWPLLRANALGYFVAWVVVAGLFAVQYAATMVAYYSLVLCCFVPILAAPIGFYLSLVAAALFGQTYRESAAIVAARKQVIPS